ncbi:major facilitator superfamily domain-containing protein [Scheffersomyces coipomensis]|uniref:major facilitator superfamily domain-containing protein n=1 Tax=Scheffersomyces coipomensis TaxID=1788519 RepID=UPI00315D0552
MGIFGTSREEEEQLRQASLQIGSASQDASRQSISSSTGESSYYVTADEGEEDEEEEEAEEESDGKGEDEIQQYNKEQPKEDKLEPEETASLDSDSDNQDDTDVETIPYNKPSIPSAPESVSPTIAEGLDAEPYDPSDDERSLRRKRTLEKIHSHRSIDLQLHTQLSRTLTVLSEKEIAAGYSNINDLDWDSLQDPANPDNWSKLKKWYITCVVALLCLCCTLGSSLYTSSIPELMMQFGASQELCISGLTFYMLGLGLGPVFTAPLSEIIGRRYIYSISLPIGMLFTLGVSFSTNMRTILVLRFFCGYFLSPALSIAGGTISEIWASDPQELGTAVALFCLAPFLGPTIGPVIGGFAAENKGWKWSASYILLMFSGLILPCLLIIPETYKPIILERRAKKRNIKVRGPQFSWDFIKKIIKNDLFRPFKMLFTDAIVFFLSIYFSFVMAVLFGFFEAYPIIFVGVYHMNLGVSGLPFIGIGIGLVAGIFFFGVFSKLVFFNKDGTENEKYSSPESTLIIGKIGSFCLPVSLFWLGWSARPSVHYMVPVAAGVPFGFGLVLIFFTVLLYFSKCFPASNVASALAANNVLRYTFASVFPLFTVQMYDNLGIGWASSVFAFISLALVPVPFVFSMYGERFRQKSKFGYEAYADEIDLPSESLDNK